MDSLEVLVCVVCPPIGYATRSDLVEKTLVFPFRRFVAFQNFGPNVGFVNIAVLLNDLVLVLALLQRKQDEILVPKVVVKAFHFPFFVCLVAEQ